MALSNQIGAYEDCFNYLDRALADTKGIRFRLEDKDYGRAVQMHMRMQQARVLERAQNARLYPSDHPQHGNCQYDKLIIRKPRADEDGFFWIYIEHISANVDVVEALSEETNGD